MEKMSKEQITAIFRERYGKEPDEKVIKIIEAWHDYACACYEDGFEDGRKAALAKEHEQ